MTMYIKFVPVHLADDHARMGWMAVLPGFMGTVHGDWSVMLVWLCGCPFPGGTIGRPL